MTPPRALTPEPIGKRIARLRSECGLTQQALAARLAVSRVGVSHIEMDLIVPSERTITLLAGIFKQTPHSLVDGTTYPRAKAEKLPLVVCSYTHLELEMALLENDLAWIMRLEDIGLKAKYSLLVAQNWRTRLEGLPLDNVEVAEREIVRQALKRLNDLSPA